jgi:hypothetical protein
LGQIFPPWWNTLPIVAGIAGSLGPTLAIAGIWYCSSPWYPEDPVAARQRLHRLLPRDKILTYPNGQIFDVITNGTGLTAGYRWPIIPADRWAIVAYGRELERKRLARAKSAPAGID